MLKCSECGGRGFINRTVWVFNYYKYAKLPGKRCPKTVSNTCLTCNGKGEINETATLHSPGSTGIR